MSHQGQKIAGRYVLEALAGEGGMATVWRAVMHGAAGFTRTVAVKEIKAEFGAIQSYIDMFVEEARVGSDLAHPNIVQVHDFLSERGTYYLVMEWVEGFDLATLLRAMDRDRQPVSWLLSAAIGLNVLHGLRAAHERRKPDGFLAPVIHRDVSPPNILLGTNGTVKLTDFGLARARDRIYSLTAPGTVKGKLSYLSPEVTYGMPVTASSDLFSAGVVLWEMLAGRRLFAGPGDLEVFNQIRRCLVPSLRDLRPDVPERMTALVHRALRPEPAERFPTARAMAEELVEVLRASDALPDLPTFLAHEISDAYQRYRREGDDGMSDEPTRPRAKLPDGRASTRGPLVFSAGKLEVAFSDSEVTTRPGGSSRRSTEPGPGHAGAAGHRGRELRPPASLDLAEEATAVGGIPGTPRRSASVTDEITMVAGAAGEAPAGQRHGADPAGDDDSEPSSG
jgi:eukaryotic-like serine/threonine-protein kinase